MHNDKFLCIMQCLANTTFIHISQKLYRLLTHHMHISSIQSLMQNNLSCITHQLNIIKCITKKYHEMATEYLSFICFVGRLHLDHSALSYSSFMKSSFIQMIRWIRGSSRIEFFSYSSSLEGSSLNGKILIFNCSHLLLLFLLVKLKVIT